MGIKIEPSLPQIIGSGLIIVSFLIISMPLKHSNSRGDRPFGDRTFGDKRFGDEDKSELVTESNSSSTLIGGPIDSRLDSDNLEHSSEPTLIYEVKQYNTNGDNLPSGDLPRDQRRDQTT